MIDPLGLDYIFTVYVDQPSKPIDDAVFGVSLGKVDTGHTWIGLEDTGTRKVHIRGFYPAKDERPNPYTKPNVRGVILNDLGRFYDVKKDYNITNEQYESALDKLVMYEEQPPSFNVNDFNCTDWAEGMGKAAGQLIPDTYSEWPGGGGSNPFDLGEALKKLR